MAPFLVGLEGVGPDEGLVLLEDVFHLEDLLRDLGTAGPAGDPR